MPPTEWWPMPWFGMMMAPLVMVIFLVIAFVIVIPLLRWLGMGPPWWREHNVPPPQRRTALDILNERFARGEIDKSEYEEKRRLISQG